MRTFINLCLAVSFVFSIVLAITDVYWLVLSVILIIGLYLVNKR